MHSLCIPICGVPPATRLPWFASPCICQTTVEAPAPLAAANGGKGETEETTLAAEEKPTTTTRRRSTTTA
jgi:hypothetical protein